MRLNPAEIEAIKQTISNYVVAGDFEIRLFGSRASDDLKGGDIDLLLICQDQTAVAQALDRKIDMLVDLKQLIGDQKIDLVVAHRSELSVDPFLKLIYPDSKSLPTTGGSGPTDIE